MGIRAFMNKQPIFDEETGGYFMDFGGRVNLPSVKNFQLIDMDDCNFNQSKNNDYSCWRKSIYSFW